MVSVIIPNYNGRRYLRTCLESLRRQTYRDFEVVVVDDGSQDGSVRLIKAEFPEVKVIGLEKNNGFSAAVNVGICESKGELVALLNNDVEADPGWLEALVSAAKQYPWAGFFACKMLQFSRRDILDGAGDAYLRFGGARRIGHGELDHGQYDESREVLGACAGAALYRRTLFDSIGLFDEDFVGFHEDIDLSLRAQWAGLGCLYVPKAQIYHIGGGTASPDSPLAVRLAVQNRWNLVVKNVPKRLLPGWLALMLFAEGYRMVRTMVRRRGVAYWQGLGSALWLLPSMLAKRRQVLGRAQISSKEFSARVRLAEREALPSLIGSNAYPAGVTRMLQWYLVLACPRDKPVASALPSPCSRTNLHLSENERTAHERVKG